jgi:hypothetical protein
MLPRTSASSSSLPRSDSRGCPGHVHRFPDNKKYLKYGHPSWSQVFVRSCVLTIGYSTISSAICNMTYTVPMSLIPLMPPLLHSSQPAPTKTRLISMILPSTLHGTQSFRCGTGSQSIQSIVCISIASCTRSVPV